MLASARMISSWQSPNILASQDVWPPNMLARPRTPRDPKTNLFAGLCLRVRMIILIWASDQDDWHFLQKIGQTIRMIILIWASDQDDWAQNQDESS